MYNNTYKVEEDPILQTYFQQKSHLSPSSRNTYIKYLEKFCKINQITLTQLITECKTQQNKIIEKITHIETKDHEEIVEKTVIRFDVNGPDSKIKQYLDTFITTCKNNENKNTTINSYISLIKIFLNYYDIETPNWKPLPDDTEKWHLLSKEDFNYIISDSTLMHKGLIEFLLSSGMRIHDATSLTIRDFMEATKEYHNFVDVEEFIDNAPEDMIGSWYFHPHKTQKYNIECQTFNSPESSNSILQNLRKLKNEYYPEKNKRDNLNLKISKDQALFGSRNTNYKECIRAKAMADTFWKKNNKLKEHHISKIKQKIEEGKLSAEDYEKEVSKIPKFHAHGCRKYFETMIARNCGNLRICTLLEGHVSPIKTDSSYIKHDIEEVKEAYMTALDDLSLEKTETKVYTSEVRREMENKISTLENELASKKEEISTMETRVGDIEEILQNMGIENIVKKMKK